MATKKLRQIVSELLDTFPVTPPTRRTFVSCFMLILLLSFTAPTGAQISTSTNSKNNNNGAEYQVQLESHNEETQQRLEHLTITQSDHDLNSNIPDYKSVHSLHPYIGRNTNYRDDTYSELKFTPTNSQENSNNNNNLSVVNNKVIKSTRKRGRRKNQRDSIRHAHDRKRRKHVSDFRQDGDEDGHDRRSYVTRERSSDSRDAVNHEKRRLPKALIIGVKKGGTRALLEFLRMHPDVKAPGPEIHYFDKHFSRGQQWYRNQMPSTTSGQLTIEKTPSYMVTKDVPSRVYGMSNQTRLIVVLRDPVTRAISDYTQTASKFSNTKRFEDLAFLDNSTGAVDTSWSALRIGIYAIHLARWLEYFPLSQMHFVSGERLITDPAGQIARVQQFLGLEPLVTEKNFLLNTEKGFPCLRKHAGSGRPHCLGKTKGRRHPDVAPRLLKRLRDFYRPFNIKLYKMVGQNFGWE